MADSSGLHAERLVAPDAEPTRTIAFLHGSFGTGRNWSTIARRFVIQCSEWAAVLVDVREHGQSIQLPGDPTLAQAGHDLQELASKRGWTFDAVLGHSLGGKVALAYAGLEPSGLETVFVVDSTPAPLERGDAWQMIALLRRLPPHFATRAEATAALKQLGLSDAVAAWMAMNIHRSESGDYRLRLDLDRIEALLGDFYEADLWDVLEHPSNVTFHFLRASRESLITEAAAQRLRELGERTGRVHLHELTGGHWLHVDATEAVGELLARYAG